MQGMAPQPAAALHHRRGVPILSSGCPLQHKGMGMLQPGRLMVVPYGEPSREADPLWERLLAEAEEAYARAPMLAPLFLDSIINQPSLEAAVFHRVGTRLKNDVISLPLIIRAFQQALIAEPELSSAMRADITAVHERDPACDRLIEPLLYFKGYHAIEAQRLMHWLWHDGNRDFALYLQSRVSEVFQVDIHPAARLGRGLFLDHATGLVAGETVVIEDDVSMLQDVTLGGTGKEAGDRHPKIRRGALIGAGAKILGNIEIGENARVASGSVVLSPVPPHTTVAGVPARPVRGPSPEEPSHSMDQTLVQVATSFSYAI
jgi:serine O-acetyltransferase